MHFFAIFLAKIFKNPSIGPRWQRLPERQRLDDRRELYRHQEPVLYAPDRGPPILDFMSIFAAFVVAVIAAYYTITH
jgi:hypothetical protein